MTAVLRRLVLGVAGSGMAAYGYLHTVAAHLGNGPLFAVQDALHLRLRCSLAVTAVLLGLVLVALAGALRAPLGAGTVVLPIANGAWIALLEPSVHPWAGTTHRWVQFTGGTAVMGGRVGVGTLVMGATVGHLFQFWSGVLTRIGVPVVPALPARAERPPLIRSGFRSSAR